MPPWPFSTGSPDNATPPARMPPSIDRYAQTSPVQSPLRFEPTALPELRGIEHHRDNPGHTSPQRGHGRSLSGTLPALFGGPKKKTSTNDESLSKSSPTTQDGARGFTLPRKIAPKSQLEDGEMDVGYCATCGTKVKWPKGISQFRCNTCMMVNDLLPVHRHMDRSGPERPGLLGRSGSGRAMGSEYNEFPLNLDRTKAIIQSCVEVYLNSRRQRRIQFMKDFSSTPPHSPLRSLAHIDKPPAAPSEYKILNSQQSPHRQTSSPVDMESPINIRRYGLVTPIANIPMNDDSTNSNSLKTSVLPSSLRSPNGQQVRQDSNRPSRPVRKPPPPPLDVPSSNLKEAFRSTPVQSPDLSDDARLENGTHSYLPSRTEELPETVNKPRTIFRALEDYLIRTFGNHQSLNTSFLIVRPVPRGPIRSDDSIPRLRSRSDASRTNPADCSLSELDAKTLLLGDVAENGLWWTGRDARTGNHVPSHKRGRSGGSTDNLVHLRSPCINFVEVSQWYTAVIGVGEDWRQSLHSGDVFSTLTDVEAKEIDNDLSEARAHIHRTLLKISEGLLKRPGRPLKSPNDIRFLLILLANPLLGSTRIRAGASENKPEDQSLVSALPTEQGIRTIREVRKPDEIRSQNEGLWDQSHAFGVLKRILGLISNLSNESHRYLTSWFARYTDSQFRRLVDLIQSFVTYRLGKQHPRKPGSETTESGFIPGLAGTSAGTSAQIHAALGLPSQPRSTVENSKYPAYSSDWQIKSAARVMALFFAANKGSQGDVHAEQKGRRVYSQILSTSDFYNTAVDLSDLINDFDTWESGQGRFAFCQYPFFLSVGAKIRIMEHDAHRQMEIKAREAFFNSILRNKMLEQYLTLKVRRECLVEDSLKGISEVVGTGQQEIKKGLKVQFINEEGVDAGGLRKEWFLLLVREIFEQQHALFVYDEDSHLCYFNPHSFETSDQYFLVGALLGLAIYNSTILDVALPPFTFKKLLASGSVSNTQKTPFNRMPIQYTLEDLAEYRPALANGFRQLLDYEGDVEANLCLDFVAEVDRYGSKIQVPLCTDGEKTPVTNSNRQEFVDLYVRYLLDIQVSRQFEPFKRGFFTVCGGNALSLFQPEEIELLIRGSDEPLDVPSLKAVAIYENWRRGDRKIENPAEEVDLIQWFWEFFENADAKDQRKLLGFITGSDRIPAMGAASLVIKIAFAGKDHMRFPIARTCFNLLLLYKYRTKEELVEKLWRAVTESEGFGLK